MGRCCEYTGIFSKNMFLYGDFTSLHKGNFVLLQLQDVPELCSGM